MDKQRESPSTDPRSTSLVDQTSASDFLSIAANVVPVTPGLSQFTSGTGTGSGGAGASGSTTATATLYALLAALNKSSPTDPTFYANHVDARRVSFTVGTITSKLATDNTDTPGAVYGTKFLVVNNRDIYSRASRVYLSNLQAEVAKFGKNSVDLKGRIQEEIFLALNPTKKARADGSVDPNDTDWQAFAHTSFSSSTFPGILASLPGNAKKQIEDGIENAIGPFSEFAKKLDDTYDKISKAQQLSISYTADIRDAKGNNEHRIELIFDYGLSPRINWTVNASGDYTDRKSAIDSKGGRFATSFQGDLTKPDSGWGKTPIRLTFSGEAKWLTAQKPQYTFESKLSIPLASGIDLPIVYRYANRIAQINQTDSEARLGLSVDISRLAQGLK